MAHAGFHVEQYHANVPSFGEWGWTLGTLAGRPASARIALAARGPTPDGWLDAATIHAAFTFPPGFFDGAADIRVNRLGEHVVYGHHQAAWQTFQGVYFAGGEAP